MKVNLEGDKLSFSGKSGGSLYEFDFEWYAPIKKEESKWSTKRLIEFYLKKEAEDSWPRLAKKKLPWVKCDWAKWQDSDDEGEKGDFDTAGMGGMPGMDFGGMGGGGGMDFSSMMGGMGGDEDSDDAEEDLPDLEPTAGDAKEVAKDADNELEKID